MTLTLKAPLSPARDTSWPYITSVLHNRKRRERSLRVMQLNYNATPSEVLRQSNNCVPVFYR